MTTIYDQLTPTSDIIKSSNKDSYVFFAFLLVVSANFVILSDLPQQEKWIVIGFHIVATIIVIKLGISVSSFKRWWPQTCEMITPDSEVLTNSDNTHLELHNYNSDNGDIPNNVEPLIRQFIENNVRILSVDIEPVIQRERSKSDPIQNNPANYSDDE